MLLLYLQLMDNSDVKIMYILIFTLKMDQFHLRHGLQYQGFKIVHGVCVCSLVWGEGEF